jgi:ABC-type thiamine transport system ATPase subunit
LTQFELEGVEDDRLGPLTLRPGPGLTIVVSDELEPLARLLGVASGVRRPRRGSARLDGVNVRSSPRARRRLAALLAEEELVPSRSVGEAAQLAWDLRGVAGSAEACLREWGLGGLITTEPRRLLPERRRAVALALALGAPAALVVLHDPLALAPLLGHAKIRDACWRAAESAVVLVGTPSFDDAKELGGELALLTRGRLAPAISAAPWPREVLVRCAESARLAELLRADAELEVGFDAARTARELFVRGPSHARVAERVLRVARDAELSVDALAPLGEKTGLP